MRPNKNLYVEYSRNYDFSRILSSLIKQLVNFPQNYLSATSDKNTNFNISKNMLYVKLGFQILHAVEQFSPLFSRKFSLMQSN